MTAVDVRNGIVRAHPNGTSGAGAIRPLGTRFALAAMFALGASLPAAAADVPALAGLSGADKTKVEQLIEGAKKEGAVSYWDAIVQPDTNDALTAAFRKYYGLPSSFVVNYTLASTAALVTRVDQEISAKRITIDVASVAAPTWLFERIEAGDILQHDSVQEKYYEKAIADGLGQKGYFTIAGTYEFLPMWSENNLKFTGKTWKEALAAVPAGRLNIGDASKSTSYLATYAGLRDVLGKQFFQDMAKKKPSMLVRSEQIASRLVASEDLMSTSGMPTRAYQNNQKGADLKFIFPEEGVVLMPHCMFILKGTAHPNAAQLWTDFILSEEGQKILSSKETLSSGRAGFKSPEPTYAPPISEIKTIKVDWKKMTTDELKKIRDEWAGIFAP